MSCNRGCDGGWHYNEATNTATPCECRRELIRVRRAMNLRYAAMRQAGCKIRGEARAQRRPSRAQRRAATPCAGPASFMQADELERRFRALRTAQERPFDQRGFNTRRELCQGLYRWSAHERSAVLETTNAQLSALMEHAGRRRERRTVQCSLRDLEAMGVIKRWHVARGGATSGHKDTIRIRVMHVSYVRSRDADCTPPPTEGGPTAPSLPLVGFESADFVGREPNPAAPGPDPPAQAGAPANSRQRETEAERAAMFAAMIRAAGWGQSCSNGAGL